MAKANCKVPCCGAIVGLLLALAFSLSLGVTRQEACYFAESQATVRMSSLEAYPGDSDYYMLWDNVFHPNYDKPTCDPKFSLFYYEWPIVGGIVCPYSWYGVPRAHGGNQDSGAAQLNVLWGHGVGANESHFNANSGEVDSWAAGVDCSALVGLASGRGTGISVSYLRNEDPYVHSTTWSNLQPGDLIMNYSHVVMFDSWTEYPNYLKVVHTSESQNRVVYWDTNVEPPRFLRRLG